MGPLQLILTGVEILEHHNVTFSRLRGQHMFALCLMWVPVYDTTCNVHGDLAL